MSVQEEDLDDLDDVLEQFGTAKPTSQSENQDPQDLDDDFMQQLNSNMAALLSGLDPKDPSTTNLPTTTSSDLPALDQEQEAEFRTLVEQMIRASAQGSELSEDDVREALGEMDAHLEQARTLQPSSRPLSPSTSSTAQPSYQDTVRQAYDKIRSSDKQQRQEMLADQSNRTEPDALSAMMASLAGSSDMSEAGMQQALEEMMGQLMSKDLLYEPIKDLCARYPEYLAEHAKSLPDEDLKRYRKQQVIVQQLAAKFEDPAYSNDDAPRRQEIIDLMQQMQDCGAPPKDMMGQLPDGFNFGADGMPSFLSGKDGMPECPAS